MVGAGDTEVTPLGSNVAKPDDTLVVVGFAKNSKADTAATNGVKTSLVPVDVGGGGGVAQEEGADAAVKLVGRTKRDTVANSIVGGKTFAANTVVVVEEVSPALENSQPAPAGAPPDEHPNRSDS